MKAVNFKYYLTTRQNKLWGKGRACDTARNTVVARHLQKYRFFFSADTATYLA